MSGHSKWSTIKRKKGEKDGARAKVFTKISREILVCIKETGNADPANNSKLATLVQKAKTNNIPNDNIDRLLKKAAGGAEKNDYENCVYEGYGPGGVAVIVDCLTDNRNRTAGEVRHYFDKFGGNMGTSGCVSFMFSLKGVIVLNNEEGTIDEDKAMEDILEAGGEDFSFEDGVVEISTDSSNVGTVAEELTKRGYEVISAQAEQVPSTYTTLTDEDQLKKMGLLLEMLDDNDDVQNVWHNWDEPESDDEEKFLNIMRAALEIKERITYYNRCPKGTPFGHFLFYSNSYDFSLNGVKPVNSGVYHNIPYNGFYLDELAVCRERSDVRPGCLCISEENLTILVCVRHTLCHISVVVVVKSELSVTEIAHNGERARSLRNKYDISRLHSVLILCDYAGIAIKLNLAGECASGAYEILTRTILGTFTIEGIEGGARIGEL